ncbi:MAG: DUF433 domain-containing protein [Ignavibacteriae bacterium]|nr:DUF433 domain-containing protein [Ignavibacteriota bacterium]
MSVVEQEQLLSRITTNPDIIVGKPTVRGMRITVEQIVNAVAAGVTTAELLEDYPELEEPDIRACLFYAARSVSAERVYRIAE